MHPLPPHVEALLQAVLMDTASSRHTCPEALLPYLLGKVASVPVPSPRAAISWLHFLATNAPRVRIPTHFTTACHCLSLCDPIASGAFGWHSLHGQRRAMQESHDRDGGVADVRAVMLQALATLPFAPSLFFADVYDDATKQYVSTAAQESVVEDVLKSVPLPAREEDVAAAVREWEAALLEAAKRGPEGSGALSRSRGVRQLMSLEMADGSAPWQVCCCCARA